MKIEKMTLVELLLLQDAIDEQLKKIRRELVKEQNKRKKEIKKIKIRSVLYMKKLKNDLAIEMI